MESVVTLTANPAIDICAAIEEIVPIRKLRCTEARRDPGGGGINVARVVRRLGSEVAAIYPAGGSTGRLLKTDEVARACAYLSTDESGLMTGSIIDFDQSVVGCYEAAPQPSV